MYHQVFPWRKGKINHQVSRPVPTEGRRQPPGLQTSTHRWKKSKSPGFFFPRRKEKITHQASRPVPTEGTTTNHHVSKLLPTEGRRQPTRSPDLYPQKEEGNQPGLQTSTHRRKNATHQVCRPLPTEGRRQLTRSVDLYPQKEEGNSPGL